MTRSERSGGGVAELGGAMPDPLMELLRLAADVIGPPPMVPLSLHGNPLREATKRRADFLRLVDSVITTDVRIAQGLAPTTAAQAPLLVSRLRANTELEEKTRLFLDDVVDADTRINISLRLYAGYLEAAKTIAWGVTGRKNTAATRFNEIQIVEARAAGDAVYRAGVESAPQYKWRVLREGIYRDGIPSGFVVLLDWED